jgi:hypothetical protein
MSRDRWAGLAATVAVAVVIILGFRVLGSPANQRLVQSDLRRVQTLGELAGQINQRWSSGSRPLPADLETFPKPVKQDPVSGTAFVYHRKLNDEYELCASFSTDTRDAPAVNTADPWIHPRGEYCFQFQASRQVPAVPYSY